MQMYEWFSRRSLRDKCEIKKDNQLETLLTV